MKPIKCCKRCSSLEGGCASSSSCGERGLRHRCYWRMCSWRHPSSQALMSRVLETPQVSLLLAFGWANFSIQSTWLPWQTSGDPDPQWVNTEEETYGQLLWRTHMAHIYCDFKDHFTCTHVSWCHYSLEVCSVGLMRVGTHLLGVQKHIQGEKTELHSRKPEEGSHQSLFLQCFP